LPRRHCLMMWRSPRPVSRGSVPSPRPDGRRLSIALSGVSSSRRLIQRSATPAPANRLPTRSTTPRRPRSTAAPHWCSGSARRRGSTTTRRAPAPYGSSGCRSGHVGHASRGPSELARRDQCDGQQVRVVSPRLVDEGVQTHETCIGRARTTLERNQPIEHVSLTAEQLAVRPDRTDAGNHEDPRARRNRVPQQGRHGGGGPQGPRRGVRRARCFRIGSPGRAAGPGRQEQARRVRPARR
jgi:hypothetical protein